LFGKLLEPPQRKLTGVFSFGSVIRWTWGCLGSVILAFHTVGFSFEENLVMWKLGVAVGALALVAGCATAPAGMKPGQFVAYQCAQGHKGFQARYNADTKSVRVRALHGSAELSGAGDGKFTGEGYVLDATNAAAVSLTHNGKLESSQCKAS
jgi:hypothetical protein